MSPIEKQKQTHRLRSYLGVTIGVSASASSFSSAAIVNIDVAALGIDGINGGATSGSEVSINNFPFGDGILRLMNGYDSKTGLDGQDGLSFAGVSDYISPTIFSFNDPIGSGSSFQDYSAYTAFKLVNNEFAAVTNGYMGFRFDTPGGFHYGWLEVSWNPSTDTFLIHDGAYEDSADTAILAGAQGVSPVPEPSGAISLLALISGGAMLRRRRAA